MLFSRSSIELEKPLIIRKTNIERVTEGRFLGVIVDEGLTWTRHIKTIQSKMSRYVGVMYKIKKLLPIKARIQLYHSFIQSHINYCSLVWGFSAKSNIETLFRAQKKGMRAVAPGFVNYFYKDGNLPSHTKSYFKEFDILTVHSIIVLNALLFLEKVRTFPLTLPDSIRSTIRHDAPSHTSTLETCREWESDFNTNIYRPTVFFKGPLLTTIDEIGSGLSMDNKYNFYQFKSKTKARLREVQNAGDEIEWEAHNFILFNISGLRKSNRVTQTLAVSEN